MTAFCLIAALSACTVYSSAGRKDFETKSPSYIKTLAFDGCEPIEQKDFDEGFLDSFSTRSFFTNDNFWVAEASSKESIVIQVVDHQKKELCTYQFTDSAEWQLNKPYFLQHLP